MSADDVCSGKMPEKDINEILFVCWLVGFAISMGGESQNMPQKMNVHALITHSTK